MCMLLFQKKMVAKPITTEFVALTEKKMDMTLGFFFYFTRIISFSVRPFLIYFMLLFTDDIIKMSKDPKTMKQTRVPVSVLLWNIIIRTLV